MLDKNSLSIKGDYKYCLLDILRWSLEKTRIIQHCKVFCNTLLFLILHLLYLLLDEKIEEIASSS